MPIGRDVARCTLVIAAAAALGALAACNVPEMVRFPDYVGPAGPAEAQEAAAAESKPPAPPPAPAEAVGPLRVAVPDAILLALQTTSARSSWTDTTHRSPAPRPSSNQGSRRSTPT